MYLPFGEIAPDNSAGTNGFTSKFTGQNLDEELGLYDYGARYYDPAIGRFISADTVVPDAADAQAWNRYTYARNNPIIYSDPTGHNFWSVLGLAFGMGRDFSDFTICSLRMVPWIGDTLIRAHNYGWQTMTQIFSNPASAILFCYGAIMSIICPPIGFGAWAASTAIAIAAASLLRACGVNGFWSRLISTVVTAVCTQGNGGWMLAVSNFVADELIRAIRIPGLAFALGAMLSVAMTLIGRVNAKRSLAQDDQGVDDDRVQTPAKQASEPCATPADRAAPEPVLLALNDDPIQVIKDKLGLAPLKYIDLGFVIGKIYGVSFGVIFETETGRFHGYWGVALTTGSGVTTTFSAADVTPGWNIAGQVGYEGGAAQLGLAPDGTWFTEYGLGTPGAAITGTYISH